MPGSPLRTALLLGLALTAGCAAPVAPSSAPAAGAPPGAAPDQACRDVTGGAPSHGVLRVAGDRVTLDAFDDYFAPSCLVVPAGRPVTLVLTNRGHLPHILGGPGLPVSASVDAGQTAFVTLPPVRQPTRLVCGLHADEQMVLAVVPAAPAMRDGDV